MNFRTACLFTVAASALALASIGFGQQDQPRSPFTISPDRTNGVYNVGEVVHWQIVWQGDTNEYSRARYSVLKGQLSDGGHGDLLFTNGIARLDSTFRAPGQLLLVVTEETGKDRAVGGAVASPGKVKTSALAPTDFDAFWKTKSNELEDVPPHPQLEPADVGNTNMLYWKISMDNIRGSHIYGQLARPAEGSKFPGLLIFQWAGNPYPLQRNWVTSRAAQGWLALNIEPHDMPIDGSDHSRAPDNFYAVGTDDREHSYFLRMYLSCYRAAEYLAGRPDWNGKVLVAMGDSMGGQQTLMIAGLYPKLTAAMALVPAGSDMLGPEIGRRGGWPQWYERTEGQDPVKVHEASRYFDVANFAPHIKCPVLVGLGLIDETCPAEGVLATFNLIIAPKELVILPNSPHQNVNGSQVPFTDRKENVWLPALREGKPAPVNQSR